MNRFIKGLRILLPAFTFFITTVSKLERVFAQSIPVVRSEMTFAGVPIYLSEAVRLQVQQEVRLLYANRRQLEQDMDALRELSPLWRPLFQEANLPVDFRYLALPFADIENSAYWSVQAEQLPAMELRISQAIDETKHPLVATEKVGQFLKQLQKRYPENAVLLLLRYLRNNGPTPGELSEKRQVESVWLTIDSPPLLWKILARKIMVEQQEPAYRPAVTYVLYTYFGGGGLTLPAIARQLHVPDDRFRPYNDWLRTLILPTDLSYPILVRLTNDEFSAVWSADIGSDPAGGASPISKVDLGFPVLLKSSVRADGLRAPATFYTINERRGIQAQLCDNPITLAYYGGISPDNFLAYNDMVEQDVVRPGQIYYLERKAKRARIPFHVVQRNQLLRDVANIYGMRLSSLLRFNHIEATKRARAGQILWLREKRPRNQPIEYQQLPPRTAPVMPMPKPLPISADSMAVPSTTVAVGERALTQPTTPQLDRDTTTAELKVVPPKPIELAKQVDTLNKIPVPSPASQIAVVATPADAVVEPPVPTPVPDEAVEKSAVPVRTHVVKPGQTYYAIGRLYGVTPGQLYVWNGLSEKIPLEIGQKLIVSSNRKPVPGRPATVTLVPGPASKGIVNKFVVEGPKPVVYHIVQPGQTVYRIALLNKTTVANIMKLNNLSDYTIEVGQKLIVRRPE